jgi:hypothetical protein
VLFSPASKILWKVQLLNVVMFLGRHSTWIFKWAKPRSCRCPGALSRTRRTLDAKFLNFRYSFCTCMVFFLTTAPPTDSHLCVWSYSHTHKVLSSLLTDRSQPLTQEMFAHDGALALMLHRIMSSFCLMQSKGKVHPRTGHKGQEGQYRYSSTLSLTSELGGVGGQQHTSADSTLGKRPSTHGTGG